MYGAAVKLLLIRHAQSQNNVIEDRPDYAQARQPDPSLTFHLAHLATALLDLPADGRVGGLEWLNR
jgi:broad specificity phosphatase PhoE